MPHSVLGSFVSLLLLASACHGQVFWSTGGAAADRVEKGNADGSGQATLWSSGSPSGNNPWGVAYHAGEGRVYWTDNISRQFNRVNADGTNFSTLFTYSPAAPFSLALDSTANEIYFVAGSSILRSDFAGNAVAFVPVSPTNTWLTLDLANRFLYWTESSSGFIRRANLDGTPTVENIVSLSYTGSPQARGIALDGAGGLYWVDANTDFLYGVALADYTGTPLTVGAGNQRVNLRSLTNGTAATPNGLASDGNALYWTEGLSGFRGVYRANFDGTGAALLFAGDAATAPLGVAAFAPIPEPGTLLLSGGGVALAAWLGRTRMKRR